MQTTQAKQFLLESNFIKNIKKFSEKRLGVCKKKCTNFSGVCTFFSNLC